MGYLVGFVLLLLGVFCVFYSGAFFCGYNVMNMEYNTALCTKKSLFADNYLEVVFKTLQVFFLYTAGDSWQLFDRSLSIEGGGKGSCLLLCLSFLEFFPPTTLLNPECVLLMDVPANLRIYKGFFQRSVLKVCVLLACASLKLLF